MKETDEILRLYQSACAAGQRMVMATVVAVKGSAYRRPGAHLLLLEDGRKAGSISTGCLENDIVVKSEKIFSSATNTLFKYDNSADDSLFGLNYGCAGEIQVLIQHQGQSSLDFARVESAARQSGRTHILASVFSSDNAQLVGSRILFRGNEVVDSELPSELSAAVSSIVAGMPLSKHQDRTIDLCQTKIFFELIKPPLRLVVLGAGQDVVPVVELAHSVGLDVHVVDERRSFLERMQSQNNSSTYLFRENENVIDSLYAPDRTAIVIMSHNFEMDKVYLERALATQCSYIGIMGPESRTSKILAELGMLNASSRVHYPIGLDLGADTQEEVALSIISEVLAFFKGATAQPLSSLTGPIHRRGEDEEEEPTLETVSNLLTTGSANV